MSIHRSSFVSFLLYSGILLLLSSCAFLSPGGYPTELESPVSSMSVLKSYETRRVSSESRMNNVDFFPLQPGERKTLAVLDGPGEITHIWMTINSPDPHHLRNIVLRVYYDGNGFPSVESPVGDFFGLGHGREYAFHNLVQAIGTNKGMNSFWPMPFRKSARVEIANEGDIRTESFYFYVDWRAFKRMPKNLGYFHAQYRQDFPCPDHQPYLILDTGGARGHFMGVNLSIHTQSEGWWGEGDDIFTVDGEVWPSLWGTGSEDYFGGAWCYGVPFHNLYFGMPYRQRLDQGPDNYWNVYRYHFENPVTFDQSLKVEIEHGAAGYDNTRRGGWNNDYASVAYWYMEKPVPLRGKLAPTAQRVSNYRPLLIPEGMFEPQAFDRASTPTLGVDPHHQALSDFMKDGRFKWFLGDHLFCQPNADKSVVGFTFETRNPLQGDLVIRMTQAPDYGRVRLRLDGEVLIDDFNGYAPEVRSVMLRLGVRRLEPGTHTFTVETLGKDERSFSNFWGIDYFRIGDGIPFGEEETLDYEKVGSGPSTP